MTILRFIKEWMLPFAIAAGVLVYLAFHNIPALGGIADWYAPHNNSFMPICMFLVLFTTFCKVDFKKLMPVRWHLYVVLVQVALVVLAVWIINCMHIVGQGLVLLESVLVCIISPCACSMAIVTAKLGGNLEETTSYTFLSNILSAFLISVFFPMLPHETGGGIFSFFSTFARILQRVSLVLLLTKILAFIVKHLFKCLHHAIIKVKDLSYYLWGGSLVVVSGTTAMNISDAMSWASIDFLATIAILSLFVCIVQFAVGRFAGRHIGKPVDCGQALGQKNTSVAIWVATVFLNPLASVGPGCYVLWQNTINSIELVAQERLER